MATFFQFFGLGLSTGLASALAFFLSGRVIRRSFGLIGRGTLMRL